MPSLRSLAQLRSLLPYAARLLPLLTGADAPAGAVLRPELGALNRHFGEIQTESRSLRTEVAGQGEQIAQIHTQLERLAAGHERAAREQEALAVSFRSFAALFKGMVFAILFLLVVIAVLSGLALAHLSHP